MSVYPTGTDTFPIKVSGVTTVRSTDVNDLQDSVVAIQNTIGVTGSYAFTRLFVETLTFVADGTADQFVTTTHDPISILNVGLFNDPITAAVSGPTYVYNDATQASFSRAFGQSSIYPLTSGVGFVKASASVTMGVTYNLSISYLY